ncbi:MAG: hypothetical protein ABIH23_19225 [bacterium]
MNWVDLSEKVALDVWKIECADVLIPGDEAEKRWRGMPTSGSGRRVELTHICGCALIAMKEMGLVEY